MTGARRRWLFVAVGVIAAVALVLAWSTLQTERRAGGTRPVPSTTPLAEQGSGGGALTPPSNVLGAPVPEPGSDSGSGESPIAPWWQRVPPVEGDLLPIDRGITGHVRIEDDPDLGLFISFDHFQVWSPNQHLSTVRVVLSNGIVVGEQRGFWADRGQAVDVGSIPIDTAEQSLSITTPEVLPDDVRALVIRDPDTGEVIGGASLIPTD
ncbi:hypothetical protein [Curtobacterium pusillum]|uniref:DM13 domain-containing protein n=1 Tax=Curtobacterium pusillum TaxID=69373 RepID=A0ABX2M8D4_9MICO|nr:hypothetical protein [Curtobacterium pusillum]NUU13728.1 hypothetical protein [Curtobacterium pusillum]